MEKNKEPILSPTVPNKGIHSSSPGGGVCYIGKPKTHSENKRGKILVAMEIHSQAY